MKKLDKNSLDLVKENIEKLKEIFPDIFTEDKIDFEKLRENLGKFVEEEEEKYNFTWFGKKEANKIALTPTNATLRPDKSSSKNWETTKNIYIEGDNLEVLKVLQKAYYKKIKMIYIDPPYNTGKDVIYKDNFSDNLKNYLTMTGQVDEERNPLSLNSEKSGRKHSNWLNMMYPRLKLARNLLKNDGAIFISIDDNEMHNIRKIMDEIFGEENFINVITIKMSEMKGAKLSHIEKKFPKIKEYLVIYAKNKDYFKLNPIKILKSNEELKKYSKYYNKQIINFEKDIKEWQIENISFDYEKKLKNAKKLIYLVTPDKEKNLEIPLNTFYKEFNKNNKINYFYNQNGVIKKVLFLEENMNTYLGDLWLHISTININKENYKIPTYANGQKPIDLIKTICEAFLDNNDIVLDFFSGSGTTADVIFRVNYLNKKNNKFILIQIPEKIEICPWMDNETKKSIKKMIDFLNTIQKPLYLTEIGKERIRRAGEKIKEDFKDKEWINDFDIGFKVFKVDTTNIKEWDSNPENLEKNILNYNDFIKSDRSEEDLLYEILLKYGIDLTTPIEIKEINGKKIYIVGFGSLFIYFDEIDINIAKEIVELVKEYENEFSVLVLKDDSFISSSDKVNIIEFFKQMNLFEKIITL